MPSFTLHFHIAVVNDVLTVDPLRASHIGFLTHHQPDLIDHAPLPDVLRGDADGFGIGLHRRLMTELEHLTLGLIDPGRRQLVGSGYLEVHRDKSGNPRGALRHALPYLARSARDPPKETLTAPAR